MKKPEPPAPQVPVVPPAPEAKHWREIVGTHFDMTRFPKGKIRKAFVPVKLEPSAPIAPPEPPKPKPKRKRK